MQYQSIRRNRLNPTRAFSEIRSNSSILKTLHSGPRKLITQIAYSSVFLKIIWSQAIFIGVEFSLITISQPPIKLHIVVIDFSGDHKLVDSGLICLRQNLCLKILQRNIFKHCDFFLYVMIPNKHNEITYLLYIKVQYRK